MFIYTYYVIPPVKGKNVYKADHLFMITILAQICKIVSYVSIFFSSRPNHKQIVIF
jgi:hypothetical protein